MNHAVQDAGSGDQWVFKKKDHCVPLIIIEITTRCYTLLYGLACTLLDIMNCKIAQSYAICAVKMMVILVSTMNWQVDSKKTAVIKVFFCFFFIKIFHLLVLQHRYIQSPSHDMQKKKKKRKHIA